MYSNIEFSNVSFDDGDVNYTVGLLLQIGGDFLRAEDFQNAVLWLERARDILTRHGKIDSKLEIGELWFSILCNLG